jgi:hypothetical protein
VAAAETLAARIRDDMRRIATAMGLLRTGIGLTEDPAATSSLVGERMSALLGRRLEEVEGAVTVATALAERTGIDLREELRATTRALADELEEVARIARTTAGRPARAVDPVALEVRFDEVHRRIDAVTRELRGIAAAAPSPPSPYAGRFADTLGRRLARLEASVEVTTSLVERTGAEIRDELADVAAAGEVRRRALADELAAVRERLEAVEGRDAADGSELTAIRADLRVLEARLGEELALTRREREKDAVQGAGADLALRELGARIDLTESDRDALTAQVVQLSESWAAERTALHERVAELAARIVTGPVPVSDGEASTWPTPGAFDQLRIAVEGLRMRLAYHEKSVAELVRGRDVDDRIDDMERLLMRLEAAGGALARGDGASVLTRLERLADRVDSRPQGD